MAFIILCCATAASLINKGLIMAGYISAFSFSQLSMLEAGLSGAEEERDNLRKDLDESNLGKDKLIKKAWETRDAAVKRKNAAEVELARERIAVMQVSGLHLHT